MKIELNKIYCFSSFCDDNLLILLGSSYRYCFIKATVNQNLAKFHSELFLEVKLK